MLLYEDDDLKLVFNNHGGDDCFVTFTGTGKGLVNGFGQQFLDPRKVSGLYFISKWDHWWHTSGMAEAIAKGKVALGAAGFKRIIAYGASMGGYGAALYAAEFNVEFGILIAPQYEIRPDLPPNEQRWMREAQKIAFSNRTIASELSGRVPFYVIFDSCSRDLAHVELFEQVTDVIRVPVPFGDHTPGVMLVQVGMLKDLVFDIINGRFDYNLFMKTLRQNRRKSAVFWGTLADYTNKRWPRLAFYAVEQASQLDAKNMVYKLRYVYLLLAAKRLEDALEAAQAACALAPDHPAPWRGLAKTYGALGRHQEAVEAAREAIKRRLNDADLQRVLLDALIADQDFEEAEKVAERAIELDPKFTRTVDLLNAVRNRLKEVESRSVHLTK